MSNGDDVTMSIQVTNQVSPELIKMLNPNQLKDIVFHNTLFDDEEICTDLRCAGDVAQQSGARFESITHDVLKCYNNPVRYSIVKRPEFYCHFGLSRQGDFLIHNNERWIHIECKELGNVESHFDKLSHCLFNLVNGCYGDEFWLVYSYDRVKGNKNKIRHLKRRCIEIKKQVAIQGITFELILIDELHQHLSKV